MVGSERPIDFAAALRLPRSTISTKARMAPRVSIASLLLRRAKESYRSSGIYPDSDGL